MKYAYITLTEGVYEVSIGRDVPGNPSHGAAMSVGFFNSFSEAVDFVLSRGVPTNRINY